MVRCGAGAGEGREGEAGNSFTDLYSAFMATGFMVISAGVTLTGDRCRGMAGSADLTEGVTGF